MIELVCYMLSCYDQDLVQNEACTLKLTVLLADLVFTERSLCFVSKVISFANNDDDPQQ